MFIEEDTTLDAEVAHEAETVGVVLASKNMTIATEFRTRKPRCNPKDLAGMVCGV